MGYLDKLTADIARWRDKGLVTAEQASELVADARSNHRSSFGAGSIVAMFAAALLAAAILSFVAANWGVMPRIWRVAGIFAIILVAYVGGAGLKLRGHDGFAEASWLVGAAAFGAGIALIGQMYHLSGDERQAILVWCAGTAIAAAALRSAALTIAAVILAAVLGGFPFFRDLRWDVGLEFPAILAVLWAIAVWTRSIAARYLILLSLIGHGLLRFGVHDSQLALLAVILVSALVFVAAMLRPAQVERLTGLGEGMLAVAIIGFFSGFFVLETDLDETPAFIGLAAIGLAAAVATFMYGSETGRLVRWLSYLAFAVQVALIYVKTVGTMLGTAGFFLVAAIGLAILAFLVIRHERRLARSTGDAA